MSKRSHREGDKVKRQSSQVEAVGKVVAELTAPIQIKGHKVAASESSPEYLVESENAGQRAAHKPESLQDDLPQF